MVCPRRVFVCKMNVSGRMKGREKVREIKKERERERERERDWASGRVGTTSSHSLSISLTYASCEDEGKDVREVEGERYKDIKVKNKNNYQLCVIFSSSDVIT